MREILVALLLLAVMFGGVQSCRLSIRKEVLAEQGRSLARSDVELTQCQVSLREAGRGLAYGQARADAREQAGRAALERIGSVTEAMTSERVRVERVLVESKRDLTCVEQLEVKLCPSIPLL
ncbi:hypothetical protein MNO14_05015 [Luteimonas sp. S4-F44]|uniref:hypothetical protein n=1 Tax=Luteimonas sp. S4-F44 TaxID=2925842 RepID=UPI001F53701B|nr:hypothetical protein [Luteimonas sp. S4-F44]UNK43447.1 hypothetical protein MNO14_05015 [Luteimonas sp. S4-F44]